MTAAPPLGMCGACREADCECCDLHVWGGPCGCGCGDAGPPLRPVSMLLIMLERPGKRPAGRQPVAPWPPGFYCGQHHLIDGENAYYDRQRGRWQCRTCRRATWRASQRRNRNSDDAREEIARLKAQLRDLTGQPAAAEQPPGEGGS